VKASRPFYCLNHIHASVGHVFEQEADDNRLTK
jgi:hypothetical protein